MADLRPSNRVRRLNELVQKAGSQAALASQLRCTPGFISQMLTGRRPVTEKTARKFERTLGLKREWMDLFEPIPLEELNAREQIAPDLEALLLRATPRSQKDLRRIAEAAAEGKLTDEDLKLLRAIADRFSRSG